MKNGSNVIIKKDKAGSHIPQVTYCSGSTMNKNKCSNISKQKSSYVPIVDCAATSLLPFSNYVVLN